MLPPFSSKSCHDRNFYQKNENFDLTSASLIDYKPAEKHSTQNWAEEFQFNNSLGTFEAHENAHLLEDSSDDEEINI